jgi:hypothetical protein
VSAPRRTLPREIVVFFPNENEQPPMTLARALMEALHVGRAEIGVDALTGGVEVRLYYDPAVLEAARAWLDNSGVVHDISFL